MSDSVRDVRGCHTDEEFVVGPYSEIKLSRVKIGKQFFFLYRQVGELRDNN